MSERNKPQKGGHKKAANDKKNQHKQAKVNVVEKPPVRKEIPMYDPQTGEPNPHYEELTGKKNPLIEARKASESDFLLKINEHEFKRKNRWIVTFPEHFKIEPWCVSRTQRPKIKLVEKKLLWFITGVSVEWENINFQFIDPINPSVTQSLFALMEAELTETFDYKLEMLDPVGNVVETWEMIDCEIISIDLGTLDYRVDDIANPTMVIKPGKVKLKK